MKKRVLTLVLTGMLVAGMAGCGFADGVKEGYEKGRGETTSVSEAEPEEDQDTSVSEPEADADDTTDQAAVSAPEEATTGNPLLDAELKVSDVMNGTKTEKLGEYAYVTVAHETMKNVTMEQFADFCNQKVKDSGYNWVTIDFGDGTGLQFAGSTISVATYGTLDEEECIVNSEGTVMLTGENTWEYTANN